MNYFDLNLPVGKVVSYAGRIKEVGRLPDGVKI